MKPGIKICFAGCLALVLIITISWRLTSATDSSRQNYEPTKNFNFLKRFICISDMFSKDQWEKNNGRSFDKEGVHLTNAKKHPVNSCHYALFCYDEFQRTGDSSYYRGFMAQVKYLMNPESYDLVEPDKIGYPYNITFHDLKPPWYSALAQSEAISVLIRYYALTRDKAALSVVTKVKNFMVASQQYSCGTMSITPEGNEWYEEYPNSKQEKQVLNGFLLAIVALNEYSHLFPDDTLSKKQYLAAIKTVKESFQFYDTGSWLKYNRGDQRQVANGYMKWQVLELKLLYEITGDLFFKNTQMLVASYCYNKPYETPGSKLMDYDFSLPLSDGKNDELEFEGKSQQISLKADNAKTSISFGFKDVELNKITDSNVNTFARFKYADSLKNDKFQITFEFKTKVQLGHFSISYAGLDSMDKPSVKLTYTDTITHKKFYKVDFSVSESENKTIMYKLNPLSGQVFTIEFDGLKKYSQLQISNIAFFTPSAMVSSDFVHYITPIYHSGQEPVSFDLEQKGMREVVVFMKRSADEKMLAKEKWDPLHVYRELPVTINNPKENYFRFLVIGEPAKPSATISKVTFNK